MRHMRLLITVFLLSFSVLLNAQSDNDSFDYVSFNRDKINRAIGTPFPEFSIIEGGEVVTNLSACRYNSQSWIEKQLFWF